MKSWLKLLCLFLLPACGWACKKSEPENTIKIGVFASLTGSTATFGQSMAEGIALAVDEVNAQGGLLGKSVRTIVEDNQSKPEEARTSVIKLIQRDKVIALLGEVASTRSLAAAPEAQKNRIPMLTPASTNPKVTQVGDFIFRACFSDDFQGAGMAKFAYQDLKLRRVAILFDVKNDYSVGLKDYFKKTFEELGGQVLAVESYSEGDIEFRAQLTGIKNLNPEALFVPGYYGEVGLIARQAKDLGLNVPLLGGDGWTSYKTLEIAGSAIDGGYFSDHYATDDPDPRVQAFIKNYEKKFGHAPDTFGVLGYDAANMLFGAIKRAGKADSVAIRDALAQTKNFSGISGLMTIAPDRSVAKTLSILKIEQGKISLFKKMAP